MVGCVCGFEGGDGLTRYENLLASAPKNLSIFDTLLKARAVLARYKRVAVSISGGSDSDATLDIVEEVKPDDCVVTYVFFDTGLEYDATKRHLGELEEKYGISVVRRKPRLTVPAACREHGAPFVSKDVSNMLGLLQRHGFDWNETPESAAEEKYGRCKSALDWYFSQRPVSANGKAMYDIGRYKLLREFIRENPPTFKISDKCCDFAKKNVASEFYGEHGIELSVTGMRRAEGGRRAGSVSGCFTPAAGEKPDRYRPLWFWSDADKAAYKEWRGLRYSDCYEVWGLKRTGCAGCPCNGMSRSLSKPSATCSKILTSTGGGTRNTSGAERKRRGCGTQWKKSAACGRRRVPLRSATKKRASAVKKAPPALLDDARGIVCRLRRMSAVRRRSTSVGIRSLSSARVFPSRFAAAASKEGESLACRGREPNKRNADGMRLAVRRVASAVKRRRKQIVVEIVLG